MPTLVNYNGEQKEIDVVKLLQFLPPDEGTIDQYYGRIGNGKTYAATADIIRDLNRGQVVYANWKVDWKGFDERSDLWSKLLKLLGLKRYFCKFKPENFHYFQIGKKIGNEDCTDFVKYISGLTSCKIYIDEGHLAFDSYEMARMDIAKRASVLHTRHFDRSIKIISQRPTAIHVTLRANVNRFFKCEKVYRFISKLIKRPIFMKTEFQDLDQNDKPDETRLKDKRGNETGKYQFAVSQRYYIGNKKIFAAYSTKYLRGSLNESQVNAVDIYEWSWLQTLKNLLRFKYE